MIARHTIEHQLEFRYTEPVEASVMTLFLRPLRDRVQVLLDSRIDTDPVGPVFGFRGPFGNHGHFLDRPGAHRRLWVRSVCTVEVQSTAKPPGRVGTDGWTELKREAADPEVGIMLQPSRFALPSPVLERFVEARGLRPSDDPLATAIELREELHRAFEYAVGSTAADSPIEAILESGRGVCQDYAHVMATILRGWGVPCRYVSGYLGPAAAGTAESESHAWVECRIPGIGWVGMDPANNSIPGERHIRVAVGRDYADVPPIRGVFRGGASSSLTPKVTISREDVG